MDPPTIVPRTPSKTAKKDVSGDFARKEGAFDRLLRAYQTSQSQASQNKAIGGSRVTVTANFAPLQTFPPKPNFRARLLGLSFEGHPVLRLENKEFQAFQDSLNDFYSRASPENRLDPSDLHKGWIVVSESCGNYYRGQVMYIDPVLKFCTLKDIDAGEYHAVGFEALWHLEERFFHTPAQTFECILEGLENIQKSAVFLVAGKLELSENKVRVTVLNTGGTLPLVSINTSKGDPLIDSIKELLDLEAPEGGFLQEPRRGLLKSSINPKPIRPLIIPNIEDSGTEGEPEDPKPNPGPHSKVPLKIKDEPSEFKLLTNGASVEVVLKEEATDYLFFSNASGPEPSPKTDLAEVVRRNLKELTLERPWRSGKGPKIQQETKAKDSLEIVETPASFHKKFRAKLLGVDNYGFFFVQDLDAEVLAKYSDLQERLNDFYMKMSKKEGRLAREELEEGKVIGFWLEGNFVRGRIFEANYIECTLVDLESHDFHFVNPLNIYRLEPEFLKLPPQAMAVFLSGLEQYLYTDAIPQAFGETSLYPPEVTVEVGRSDEVYLASSVRMGWGERDVAELLLEHGGHFLTPLEEADWKEQIERQIMVREMLLRKKYLAGLG